MRTEQLFAAKTVSGFSFEWLFSTYCCFVWSINVIKPLSGALEEICSAFEPFPQYLHTITKTFLYNFDPFKPHFYIVKLGFTGVHIIFSYFCSKT